MTNMTETKPTLVVGGTGKTGRRIAERLAQRAIPTRVGSRSAQGSGQTPFDWENQATWEPALRGVRAAYVSYYPDVAVPGADTAIATFADMAVANGVQRLVLLSGRGETGAELSEQAVQKSGLEWTILRSSWFSQNFSEGYLLEPVLSGEVALPVGDIPEPFVDIDDLADAAVAALTEDGHAGQLYEMTGPRLMTFADAVAEISAATGREIHFVPITMADYAVALTEYGLSPEAIWLITYLFAEVMDGRNAVLTDGIQRALGREPRDFRDFASAAAANEWTR